MMKIVGLNGPIGSGKSHLADDVPGALRIAVADPLREELVEAGFPRDVIYTRSEKPDWLRRLLQGYGMGKRALNPDYWCDKLYNELQQMYRRGAHIVIVDDVRFPNEADTIMEVAGRCGAKGAIIRVVPDGPPVVPTEGMECESERSMLDYDFDATIINRYDEASARQLRQFIEVL